jgi:hypothetical protein
MLTECKSSGDPGFDAGGIWIRRARKLTPTTLAEEITRYWIARGAKRVEEPAVLGIAIVTEDPWLYVSVQPCARIRRALRIDCAVHLVTRRRS